MIGKLMERLKDDAATFTAPEVRALIEYQYEQATKDIYNNARVADTLAKTQAMAEESARIQSEFEARRLAELERIGRDPYTLKVVTDDGTL